MTINSTDGTYGLDCWENPASLDYADQEEYSESIDELRARALILLRAGRFKHIELSRWNADIDDWVHLETFTEDDLDDLGRVSAE